LEKKLRNFGFFTKTIRYGKIFKICSEKIHRNIYRRVIFKFFVKFGRREIDKIMRYLLDKKMKISPGRPALASVRIVLKVRQVQPRTMYSECSRFHSNRLTFGGVIAERVNAVETRRKVMPIFS